ncbi:MAG: PDZ domain-containing protein [Deltaproteobacteria bacterium]|nr:PDZ domain-containing protein [Deltaproteobacteria bacterium]
MTKKFSGLILSVFAFFLLTGFIQFKSPEVGHGKPLNLQNIKRISRSAYLIQHEYYDPVRIQPRKMLEEGFYELAKEVPEILPKFHENHLEFYLGAKKTLIPLDGIKNFYDVLYPISLAFDFIHDNYDGESKFEDMEYAFIGGMLSILDPHSNILPPKVYEEFKTQTQGEYGGLGIVIGIKDKELTVISPIEDTPADKAGLQADDKIKQIDGQSTINMSLTDAVDLMRGRPNTNVVLQIKSKNRDPRDVTLTREIIAIKSVVSKIIKNKDSEFGVIRVKGFQEDTFEDMVAAVKSLNEEAVSGLDGLILDLRNNPGGLLDQAILIADHFLNSGDIVYTVGANNEDEEVAVARKQRSDVELPMVVLINPGSASASEIVAGALKNNNRAIVMGQTSFGKGSVQSLFNLREGSSLKLTVAQYLTPGRESIQAVGIVPDIHLYPSLISEEFYDLFEDEGFGEVKLDSHLDNKSLVKSAKPFYEMTYLKLEEATPESSYVSKIKEDDDFPLQLAQTILKSLPANEPKPKQLVALEPILKTESSKQDLLIAKELKERGIDWSKGQKIKNPNFAVEHQFLDEQGNVLTQIPAGKTITFKVTITNANEQAVFRTITDVESLNPLLNHKEFVFGKLEAGESKTAQVEIKVPNEIISFTERLKLNTHTELTEEAPHVAYVQTEFLEKEQPKLAYSYKVKDGNAPGTTGNRNGLPEKGETIGLDISLFNLSEVSSKNTTINIKNNEGRFVNLTKARENIGELKPNQSITKQLTFSIAQDFDKDEFSIDFFAIDDETKAVLSDTLKFALGQTKSSDPKPGDKQVPPSIIISNQTQKVKDKLLLKGMVSDEQNLKDLAIFVKGKKLVYINLEDQSDSKSKIFEHELPLEDGVNSVVIQARGKSDLVSQKTMSVVYHEDEKMLSKM